MRGDSFTSTAYRRLCDQQTLHDARPQEQLLSVACDVSCSAGDRREKRRETRKSAQQSMPITCSALVGWHALGDNLPRFTLCAPQPGNQPHRKLIVTGVMDLLSFSPAGLPFHCI